VLDLRECTEDEDEEESDLLILFVAFDGRTFSDDETSFVAADVADDLDLARPGTMCEGTTCLELARISFSVRGEDFELFASPPSNLPSSCFSLLSSPRSALSCACVNATPASITLDAETTTPPGSSMSATVDFSLPLRLGDKADVIVELRDGDIDALFETLLFRGDAGLRGAAADTLDDCRAAAAKTPSPRGFDDEFVDVIEVEEELDALFTLSNEDEGGCGGGTAAEDGTLDEVVEREDDVNRGVDVDVFLEAASAF
jgi:hypothetical protein